MAPYSEVIVATAEIVRICTKLKPEVEKKTGKTFAVFTASFYKELDVTGFIYLIQVKVGGNCAVHLKVYQSPSTDIVLLDVQDSHKEGDVITPF